MPQTAPGCDGGEHGAITAAVSDPKEARNQDNTLTEVRWAQLSPNITHDVGKRPALRAHKR